MPELPEVETTLRGLTPYLQDKTISRVVVRCRKLRWKIPDEFEKIVLHQTVSGLSRRGKYLLIHLQNCTVLIHLGMSGRLCVFTDPPAITRHDHLDIYFSEKILLRYTDPRRFGAILVTQDPSFHPLIKHLGVEPLSDALTVEYVLSRTKNRRIAIKPWLMDSKIIVGVGNIYATEALFLARIHPAMPVTYLTDLQAYQLIASVKQVLKTAIACGGTTLKDFLNTSGKPGYFTQQLKVYGRVSKPCLICNTSLQAIQLGQRTTTFCPNCQYSSHVEISP